MKYVCHKGNATEVMKRNHFSIFQYFRKMPGMEFATWNLMKIFTNQLFTVSEYFDWLNSSSSKNSHIIFVCFFLVILYIALYKMSGILYYWIFQESSKEGTCNNVFQIERTTSLVKLKSMSFLYSFPLLFRNISFSITLKKKPINS